jgi:hypothetical protein
MNHQARVILDALLIDIRNDREITKEKALAALIMVCRETGMDAENFREMSNELRGEFGTPRMIWEATGVALMENIPEVDQGRAITLMRQE